ncbi:uncharacterized protein LOC124885620 [Capsicum annuum]|uniref:uncharacterized protein LOC124885620 n=1 Tax=Capsicum annuum TaxID=4072 RepID=UPI001FB13C80|nr:uncharacterized protein LOC124885620 [Capsicum annuum]
MLGMYALLKYNALPCYLLVLRHRVEGMESYGMKHKMIKRGARKYKLRPGIEGPQLLWSRSVDRDHSSQAGSIHCGRIQLSWSQKTRVQPCWRDPGLAEEFSPGVKLEMNVVDPNFGQKDPNP